ncbi:MAG TPA: hypothetical protein VGR21_11895, partial [Cryptosporangiaceae bacterium]|nr:hypothetical protein [Cryptosporangiaceae bacterium]
AHAVNGDGVIDLGDSAAVIVAAGTVNLGLRTGAEQAALVGGYAGWLHSLTGPVQVVVSARKVDLTSHAQRVIDDADQLPHPALADAAWDYADFLTSIAADRDPLGRTVTITCTATGQQTAGTEAMRRAVHTAAALAPLGVATRVLDGPTTLAALTAAVDPYQDADPSWGRALPQTPITTGTVQPPADWS